MPAPSHSRSVSPAASARPSPSSPPHHAANNRGRRTNKPPRRATVYDAVAGRVTLSGFHLPSTQHHAPRTTITTTTTPLTPSETLFKRPAAPDRIAEYDIYTAHARLDWSQSPPSTLSPRGSSSSAHDNSDNDDDDDDARGKDTNAAAAQTHHQRRRKALSPHTQALDAARRKRRRLPDGELLRSVHAYAASFYAAMAKGGTVIDTASLDETALLALGVLVEEAVESVLGAQGEGVFVEGLKRWVGADNGEEGAEEAEDDGDVDTDNGARDVEQDVARVEKRNDARKKRGREGRGRERGAGVSREADGRPTWFAA